MSWEQAQQRVALEWEAADLQTRLLAEEPTRFAGLYVDETQPRVVVRLVGNPEQLLAKYTANSAFVAERAQTPLLAERNKQAAMERAMAARRLDYASDFDVVSGRFRIGTPDVDAARQAILGAVATTNDVDLVEVDQVRELVATILGGSRLDGTQYCSSTLCKTELATTGFSVTNGTTKGVLTAGHFGECVGMPTSCVRNSASKDQTGTTLTWMAQSYGGANDFEWRTASNTSHTFANTIRYATTTMAITQVRDATTFAVNTTVCKQGRTTGYTCGPIKSTSSSISVNGSSGTYVRFAHSTAGTQMCDSGDSGGPVFLSATALGLTQSKSTTYPGECYFMPIQRINALGLSVLTS